MSVPRCRGWTVDFRTFPRGYRDPRYLFRAATCVDTDPTLANVAALTLEDRDVHAYPRCATASYLIVAGRGPGQSFVTTDLARYGHHNVCRRHA